MKKKLLILLVVTFALTLVVPTAFAEQYKTVYLTLFYGDGCPHCHKEILFLEKLEKELPNVNVKTFEIYNHPDNAKLMQEVGKKLNQRISGVPFLVIGDETLVGYLNDETTGEKIKQIIKKHSNGGCYDIVGQIMGLEVNGESTECEDKKEIENIELPIFGEINIKNWSLPILTILIAAVDGFNPCAMWVLLFLISLLIGIEDKKKMWTLGSAFIVTSALVYFLFLSAWLNLFLFLGFISIIRIIVGLVAIGSGGYHIKEWWFNRNATCRVTNGERRQKIMNSLRRVTEQRVFWLALLGIIGVAFAVNLIELVCSAGLPAIYTQILSLSDLSPVVYYLYLFLYILIFMLDDLAIFFIAMTTLQATGISTKYTHWANFIGGIIILVLGILLIFKPGWIMFG